MSNVSKLSATNYLMWSLQVHALVDGYGLIDHLDGSTEIPPPVITIDGETTANPDHIMWKRQDRLLYSTLLGAITLPLQPLVSEQVPLLKSGRHSLQHMSSRAVRISRTCEINSNFGRRKTRLLMPTYKVLPPDWTSLPSSENPWIMKIRLMLSLMDYQRNIRLLWTRLKDEIHLHQSHNFMRSFSTMKPSSPPLQPLPSFLSQRTWYNKRVRLRTAT